MAFYLSDIYTFLLIFSTIVLSILILIDKNRILLLLEYGINQKYAILYHRQDTFVYLVFVFIKKIVVLSILMSFYFFHINNNLMSFYELIKIMCLLTGFYIFRVIINYCLGSVFEMRDCAKKYQYSYNTNLLFLSVVFLPIILFVSYYKEGMMVPNLAKYVVYLFLFSYFILKIILLNRLNVFKISAMFYNILYLCALEIAPYLGLYKFFKLTPLPL